MSVWFNYATKGGYSLNDGLGEGRWVPRPGSFGIQDWVGELEQTANTCATCTTGISERATYCQPCKRAREVAALRAKRGAA